MLTELKDELSIIVRSGEATPAGVPNVELADIMEGVSEHEQFYAEVLRVYEPFIFDASQGSGNGKGTMMDVYEAIIRDLAHHPGEEEARSAAWAYTADLASSLMQARNIRPDTGLSSLILSEQAALVNILSREMKSGGLTSAQLNPDIIARALQSVSERLCDEPLEVNSNLGDTRATAIRAKMHDIYHP